MAKKLRLHILGKDDEILRADNQELSFPLSDEIKDLIEDMKLTVKKAPGIGLAAPQVGKNLMLAIINLEELGEPFAIINPKIVSKSIKKTDMEEGCLSIPGQYHVIRRPKKVEVSAYTEDGHKILIQGDEMLAKVLQHEIDHLNATLIVDRK